VISVESLMKRDVVVVDGSTSVSAAARRMSGAAVGAVLVVDGDELAGIFTERDLLTRVVAEGRDPASTPVGSVATGSVVHVALDASLRRCAELLRDHGIRHLPVVDGRKPVGILSARDFFDAVAAGLERMMEHARYDEALRDDRDPYDHLGGSYGR
jgi:CBS domain-containing protein